MNTKKMVIVLLILMFLFVPITFASDGDYKIPSVIKDITVHDDGAAEITEEIFYDIEGSVNGVYREIPLSGNQSVSNISVETPGYYNKLEINNNKDSTRIKVWLYADAAKTQKTENAKVNVTYKYTITKGVKIYNDIAELQYMTWGDEWDSKVDYLKSIIHIPGSKDNVEYWNNPEDNVVSSQWTSNDTLTTELENINSHTLFEQRLTMPKSYFTSTVNAQVIDMDAKDQIEQDQKEYQEKKRYENNALTVFFSLLAILFAIPFAVYAFFGREPKIDYDADYEYDLPTDATPVQVNSIVIGDVGKLDTNAISATILDLIDRKYFKIVLNDATQTVIRQTDRDTSDLKDYELAVMEFLSKYAVDGDISIGAVGRKSNRNDFKTFRHSWMKMAQNDVPDSMIKQYFNDKGSKLFKVVAVMFVLFFLLTMFSAFIIYVPVSVLVYSIVLIPVYIIASIILYMLPNTLGGRWTPEGKEFHDKWKNFEKYIKDYSLIAERPPASVQVWGKYLVYAAALGCADQATRNMKQYFNSLDGPSDFSDSSAVSFAYFNGFAHVESSFVTLSRSESSGSSSGIGMAGGGGFGGGGGGTF